MSEVPFSIFCTTPLHMEDLARKELTDIGGRDIRVTRAGVSLKGNLRCIYTICLCSRIISRVLLSISTFPASSGNELYEKVSEIRWDTYFEPHKSIIVHSDVRSSGITHSHYASQVVKDGIADVFRKHTGTRPRVEPKSPDITIRLYLDHDVAHVSLDLSGESLGKRGYRKKEGDAPLKETAAAALLIRAGWEAAAKKGGTFLDPMCGSGTLPVEAALLAGNIAPGLLRKRFGFHHWKGHREDLWRTLRKKYLEERNRSLRSLPIIAGYDISPSAVAVSRLNVRAAGLEGHIIIEKRSLEKALPPPGSAPGLVAVNPPYGRRIKDIPDLKSLYNRLGRQLSEHFRGWSATIITEDRELAHAVGLKARSTNVLYNGSVKCTVAHFTLNESNRFNEEAGMPSPGARMFQHRIEKNARALAKWLKEQSISCYRLYDADMPEYAVAVDIYENTWAVVQEYAPPSTVNPEKAEKRLKELLSVLPGALNISSENIFLKQRKPQKGKNQYQRNSTGSSVTTVVREGGLKFQVNFTDYIDSGLFLDHRETRALLRTLAEGRRFLNLFAYTGSGSVYAAAGGALATMTVDISGTYLDWAKKNMALNGFSSGNHRYVQADVRDFLENPGETYDLIYLDPPTFSNRTGGKDFVLQKDHGELIRTAAGLLDQEGILVFSNNYRKFRLDTGLEDDFEIENITASTIPRDFQRNRKIHHVWLIKGKKE